MTGAPVFPLSTLNCTLATPTLSDAVAVTVVVPERVALAVGEVIDTAGGVVSAVVVAVLPLTIPAQPLRNKPQSTVTKTASVDRLLPRRAAKETRWLLTNSFPS